MRIPALLVLALVLTGCTNAPPAEAPQVPELRMVALDGRWSFDPAKAAALLSQANASPPLGALVFAEARGARSVADVAGVDAGAAAALGISAPTKGEAVLARAYATRERLDPGGRLALTAASFPSPYVATYFEMERTPTCANRAEAKLCFLPELEPGTARLRLRVDEGARDAAFLPDMVELGPQGRPAWWNGTFASPEGVTTPFLAHAGLTGELTPAERPGPLERGEWVISFRLEVNGKLAPSGAAGIVRVREPGYLWFDDRLQEVSDPAGQARSVLANGTQRRIDVRIARIVDDLPGAADVLLAYEDALALANTTRPTALLANLTRDQMRAMGVARGADGVTTALRARPLPAAEAPRAVDPAGALIFVGPPGLDLRELPPVEGALAPSLALAGRSAVGEPFELDGERAPRDTLLLAHAAGPVSWSTPPGGRWTMTSEALENLSRSRTLALASSDLLAAAIATMRVEMGDGNTTRSMVAIGGVVGGPHRVLWTSTALVAGAGQPVGARVILPLAAGADRSDVAEAALAAWAPFGLVLDR